MNNCRFVEVEVGDAYLTRPLLFGRLLSCTLFCCIIVIVHILFTALITLDLRLAIIAVGVLFRDRLNDPHGVLLLLRHLPAHEVNLGRARESQTLRESLNGQLGDLEHLLVVLEMD